VANASRITFVRPDPTEHALLVCKLGPQWGNLKGTESFKPGGTEWATEEDIADAGYVPKDWRTLTVRLLELVAGYADENEIRAVKQGIRAEVLTEAHLRFSQGEGSLLDPKPEADPGDRAVVAS
jgi:hypothetical protein